MSRSVRQASQQRMGMASAMTTHVAGRILRRRTSACRLAGACGAAAQSTAYPGPAGTSSQTSLAYSMHSTICSHSRSTRLERANMKCQSTSNYRECGHVDLRPRVPAFAVCMWPLSHKCVDISIRVSRSVARCQPRTKTARHRQPCGTLTACSGDALPCAWFRAPRSALAWRGASRRIAFRLPSPCGWAPERRTAPR